MAEGERIVVIGQTLLQVKKAILSLDFDIFAKKKKKTKKKTSFPLFAVHLARFLILLDRCVLIQAHTKPLRPPLQSKEKQLLSNSLLSGPCVALPRGFLQVLPQAGLSLSRS